MIPPWKRPIFLLIAVNVLIGFFVYRAYGLAWDEPYFYSYADALGYAYSPANWLRADFDLNNSYGASGEDHKTRGPAYLLLARSFVYGLRALGADSASAWHLVNFLFFQLGVYFLYRISTRWMSQAAAFASALLFSTQPLLWGHAFINPKDPPFLIFFLASVCLGFEMVDAIVQNTPSKKTKILIAALFLGAATSIRILGPLAGLLVLIYFIARLQLPIRWNEWKWIFGYGLLAVIMMFLTWPYLWENPITNFLGVFRLMSDNPTNLSVLFNGQAYRAGELPLRYLPFMLATTLTEPVWILFFIGLVVGLWRTFSRAPRHLPGEMFGSSAQISAAMMLAWFLIVLAYVFVRRPAMYDGFRHFLFTLPPVFVYIGFAFGFLLERVVFLARKRDLLAWLYAGLTVMLILPGIAASVRLHPYEYTYYNSFIGGTDGAFRNYETDYWLTCYKEAVERLNKMNSEPVNLFVKRESYVAAPYANANITVRELRAAADQVQSGDLVLVNTRLNDDRSTFRDAIELFRIQRGNATFCIMRQIP
jgi:hypothetical protein